MGGQTAPAQDALEVLPWDSPRRAVNSDREHRAGLFSSHLQTVIQDRRLRPSHLLLIVSSTTILLYDYDRVLISEAAMIDIAPLIKLRLVYEMRRKRGRRRFHCLAPYEIVLQKADAAVNQQPELSRQCSSQQDVRLERRPSGAMSTMGWWNRRASKRRIDTRWMSRARRIAA